MSLVLDTSMTMAWHVTRSDPSEAAIAQDALGKVMTRGAIVPALWFSEVANAILMAERHRAWNQTSSQSLLADLDALPISSDTGAPRINQLRVISIARTHNLTAYDATYLELALRLNLPLATFDQKLAQAARSAGVPIFGKV